MNEHSVSSSLSGAAANTLTRRLFLHGAGANSLTLALMACGGSDSGGTPMGADSVPSGIETVSGSSIGSQTPGAAAVSSFNHASLFDFDRMRTHLSEAPWAAGWHALTSSGRAQLGRLPNPQAIVIRGAVPGENFRIMVEDMQRAYQFALRWQISGDTRYADAAVQYMDAWSSTMTSLSGNSDRFLAAGLYGYQWALAGEIMRSYVGWSATGIAALQRMLLNLFYPLSSGFFVTHNGANITNYWANWDLISIIGVLAIGIFGDRRDIYDEALNYYKTGRGNGAADHSVYCTHPGNLGQWQEMARDNGHSTLSVGLNGLICEIAWSQGDDLYSYRNNRFLAGAEYVAKCQLTDSGLNSTIPFARYANRQGVFTVASTSGRPNNRPCWEVIYNHYVNRMGLSAPNVAAMAARLRPEMNEWVGDMASFGTLTYSLLPMNTPKAPTGLTAYVTDGAVLLSWWGSALAMTYEVQRSNAANGTYTTVATLNSTDLLTWTDTPATGTWYYRVSTIYNGQTLVGTDRARVQLASELRLHLPLNQSSGTLATDATSYARNGSLQGGAAWATGRNAGNALSLTASTHDYLSLPEGVLQDLGDFTIAVWVYWNSATNNGRVFDFGSSDIAYLCLIPRDSGGVMRFSVSGTTYFGEQTIAHTTALPTGVWTHVAVTLKGKLGTLYVNGLPVGTNAAIDLAPFQLGATLQNWLGRSQYSADPYFDGKMQDLRIYSGALGASEVAALVV